MASSLIVRFSFPRPRCLSLRARCSRASICSVESACNTYTRVRESKGAITSKDGFSVVAPISVMLPASTCGRKASCWALLNRCTSSMNTIVRRPARRECSAADITSLISLIPVSTALNATNSDCVMRAISRASVVLPHPGGPHKIMEPISSRSICVRRGFPGPSSDSCPVNSSSVRGLMRSARGCPAALPLSSGSSFANRLIGIPGSTQRLSLAHGLVKQHGRGHRRVQRFHADRSRCRSLRNAHARVGDPHDVLRQACSLVSDQQGRRRFPVGLPGPQRLRARTRSLFVIFLGGRV